MNHTQKFVEYMMKNNGVQNEIAAQPISFEWVQTIAAKHGYIVTFDELNSILEQSPELVDQLQTLINEAEIELNEAEMALIAGGSKAPCNILGRRFIDCDAPQI